MADQSRDGLQSGRVPAHRGAAVRGRRRVSRTAGGGEVSQGFLAWHDVPFRKTHDLAEIGRQCAEIDPSLESLLRRAATLTEYAWKFRYPGDPQDPTREEAERALTLGREVYEAIIARLPSEVRP